MPRRVEVPVVGGATPPVVHMRRVLAGFKVAGGTVSGRSRFLGHACPSHLL